MENGKVPALIIYNDGNIEVLQPIKGLMPSVIIFNSGNVNFLSGIPVGLLGQALREIQAAVDGMVIRPNAPPPLPVEAGTERKTEEVNAE